jgi:hypothetical protein
MTTTTTTASIELGNWNQNQPAVQATAASTSSTTINSSNEPYDALIQELEPADGGPAAWRLLVAAFVFEALLWGKLPPLSIFDMLLKII